MEARLRERKDRGVESPIPCLLEWIYIVVLCVGEGEGVWREECM